MELSSMKPPRRKDICLLRRPQNLTSSAAPGQRGLTDPSTATRLLLYCYSTAQDRRGLSSSSCPSPPRRLPSSFPSTPSHHKCLSRLASDRHENDNEEMPCRRRPSCLCSFAQGGSPPRPSPGHCPSSPVPSASGAGQDSHGSIHLHGMIDSIGHP